MTFPCTSFVGKMELLSPKFEKVVKQLFEENTSNIIATVPSSKEKPIPFIDSLKKRDDCTIFLVTKSNRNTLENEIISAILSISN